MLESYVPVDISPDYLERASRALAQDFPRLRIVPVCADYTRRFELPRAERDTSTIVYFPGSTVGNFRPGEAKQFLKSVASLCRDGGGLLIGVDLKKNQDVLEAAYNDARGVTASFNVNLLSRINRELAGDFDLRHFRHRAFYDVAEGRIEMQLVSGRDQVVHAAGATLRFAEGEPITTEYSYKYTVEEFRALAAGAGFSLERVWMDESRLFSVQYYTTTPTRG
jgi:dimethylhistidine N-methyltransferase